MTQRTHEYSTAFKPGMLLQPSAQIRKVGWKERGMVMAVAGALKPKCIVSVEPAV
jgi:hypothetical protein